MLVAGLLATFAHAQASPPGVKMNATPTNIVQELIDKQKTVPALAGIRIAHFKDGLLHFERGRHLVPNEQYEEQMIDWRTETAARNQPDKMGMKRHALKQPSKERVTWDKDGVSIWMEFTTREPVDPLTVRAAIDMPVPGFEAIALTWVASEYVAQLSDTQVTMTFDGPMRGVTEQAVFDFLLYYQEKNKTR